MKGERILHDRLAEEVLRARPRGLEVILARKPGHVRAAGIFAVRFGSCDLEFEERRGGERVRVPEGVAHFLEHKLFEGDEAPVFARYAALGASCNAATSFRSTNYHFTCVEALEECLDLLLDFVQRPRITQERVEKEKGIIEQEIRMYEDDPDWKITFNLLGALYHEHPVRVPPGGTVASVRSITLEDCLRCHGGFYRPEKMLLLAAGDFDPEAIVRRIESRVEVRDGPPARAIPPPEPPGVRERSVEETFALSRSRVLLGFRDPGGPGPGEGRLRLEVETAFALETLFGRSSPVYQDLYERGAIDDSFATSTTIEDDFAFTTIGGETDDPRRFEEEVTEALERAGREGFPPEEFERVRRRHLGAAVRRYGASESTAFGHLRDALRGVAPFALLATLEAVTRESVESRLRSHLSRERAAVSRLLRKS